MRHGRPVLVGDPADPHVDAVVAQIRDGGGEPAVVDAQRLRAGGCFWLDGDHLALNPATGSHRDWLCPPRGWVRRLAPATWAVGVVAGSHEGAVRASWLSLLIGWLNTAPTLWLTPLPALLTAENKSVQLAAARAIGIEVPRTLVTSSVEAVRETFGERVLVKPLGPGHLVDLDGQGVVVPATTVRTADLGSEVAGCPFLFQEPLAARRHLRVVTVGDRSWVAALDADGRSVDWRLDDEAHDCFTPAGDAVAGAAAEAARRLARRLGVGFSSQDWIDTGERLAFLDLNPAGQWLFLPPAVADPVTAALARWLGEAGS